MTESRWMLLAWALLIAEFALTLWLPDPWWWIIGGGLLISALLVHPNRPGRS